MSGHFPKDERSLFILSIHLSCFLPSIHTGSGLALILCIYYKDNSAELTETPFPLSGSVQSAGGGQEIDI